MVDILLGGPELALPPPLAVPAAGIARIEPRPGLQDQLTALAVHRHAEVVQKAHSENPVDAVGIERRNGGSLRSRADRSFDRGVDVPNLRAAHLDPVHLDERLADHAGRRPKKNEGRRFTEVDPRRLGERPAQAAVRRPRVQQHPCRRLAPHLGLDVLDVSPLAVEADNVPL